MKTIKYYSVLLLLTLLMTSCYTEVIVDDTINGYTNTPTTNAYDILSSYDLWYVDINKTVGYGETPFLQKAFTISFLNGRLYANNNLVGIGSNGNGYGIDIGDYNTNNMILNTEHIIDGFDSFDIYQVDYNTIELYNVNNDTSYFLNGYQRANFDYDFVFYDNIHYFLQEYKAWEKTYTSNYGSLNEFDHKNYLQFLSGNNDGVFRSSQNPNGSYLNNILWDFTGDYTVENVNGQFYSKNLYLDYSYFTNEFFKLTIINDGKIRLFHSKSGTTYEFTGRKNILFYKNTTNSKNKTVTPEKKRKQRTAKTENNRERSRN